jgi:hypothetical protein
VKREAALSLLLISLALSLLAAEKSQSFLLPVDVEAGDVHIPQGKCDVTWSEPSGSRVKLTIQTEGSKPIVIPARIIEERHSQVGITTFVDNGVTYLQDFHTTTDTFILSGRTDGPK